MKLSKDYIIFDGKMMISINRASKMIRYSDTWVRNKVKDGEVTHIKQNGCWYVGLDILALAAKGGK